MPVRSWKTVLIETYHAIGKKHLGLLAAGVAFYMFFAIVPALGAAVWILGLLSEPSAIRDEVDNLSNVLPQEALTLIQQQLIALTKQSAGLTVAGLINLALALFTARTAASSMIEALNDIHGVEETRGFFKVNAIAILFTVVAVITMVAAIMAVVVVPPLLSLAGLSDTYKGLIRYLRWPLLAGVAVLALAVAYCYGPARTTSRWRWLSWGSVIATLTWLIVSAGFSWYVAAFNSYDRIYGSLGAVIVLLFWFWLTAFAGLLGAQLDKQIEKNIRAGSR
ncbi:MAG: YihY/virulence factor BrkB family protein [Rhodomicrobium sp.]